MYPNLENYLPKLRFRRNVPNCRRGAIRIDLQPINFAKVNIIKPVLP